MSVPSTDFMNLSAGLELFTVIYYNVITAIIYLREHSNMQNLLN